MPIWSNLNFQNSNSPMMEHLEFFHDHSMIILMAITLSAMLSITNLMTNIKMSRFPLESQELELFWTLIPTTMLIFIALPSLKILYMTDEILTPNLTIKCLGNQWYWSYEYPEGMDKTFEAFNETIPISRNLISNNQMIIPSKTPIRCLISSSDVLHAWTIPSLGVKADATPGRLNQLFFSVNRPGVMSGQCSEICGTNHSFMPISMVSTPLSIFSKIA